MLGKTTTRDHKAFEILVREHHRRVLAYARSLVSDAYTAEDLVQDALLIAYQRLDRFDNTRDFGAWVRGIVRMKYLELGRQHRDVPLDEATLDAVDDQYAQWDQARKNDGPDVFVILEDCMKRLPDVFLQVVKRFYFGRKSCEGIARELDTGEPTIRQRLHRGRKSLQECMETKVALDAQPMQKAGARS
jgi:RNA polymerase sigma-70 factor (ECF subfamily)